MSLLVQIVRILVGALFIFSGLVKANDPMGLSYKMQEFFEVWGWHGLNGITLSLSVLMNAFEIIAGFALLLGWRIRPFIWLLLILILFFTFLTGYTYITGQPKNCGCFGDCLPISSQTSFLKDLLLTLLIGFLLWQRRRIRPLFGEKGGIIAMLAVATGSFGLQWYSLQYLPPVDCLPFKKGNNITEKMKVPANAIPAVYDTRVIYRNIKTGEKKDMSLDQFNESEIWKDSTWKSDTMITKLIAEGKNNEPPIKGFTLSGETNQDSTAYVLEQPQAVLLFIEKFSKAGKGWISKFEKIYSAAAGRSIPVFMVTAEPRKAKDLIANTAYAGIPVFKCDYKVIQTAARAPVVVYILEKGTIRGKWSSPCFSSAEKHLNKLPQSKTDH